MAYVAGNPKTKKAIKMLIKDGHKLTVFSPGVGQVPKNGIVYLEGPHYPKPHTWYAKGQMKDGHLISIK